MPITLAEAVAVCQEALRALREAERELGWSLARKKLDEAEGKLGFLLEDDEEEKLHGR